MKKTLLFVQTSANVVPYKSSELCFLFEEIKKSAVTVVTSKDRGAAVIICDRILTSIYLISVDTLVQVIFHGGEVGQAVTEAIDETNHLAKLKPVSLTRENPFPRRLQRMTFPKPCGPKVVGDPLLIAKQTLTKTKVFVAAILYIIDLCERKEKDPETSWKMESLEPSRVVGGGVWDLEGKLAGIAIGRKIPSAEPHHDVALKVQLAKMDPEQVVLSREALALPRVYTVPSEAVLNFAETKH